MATELESKARGLYTLHRQEREHEDRALRRVAELQGNHDKLQSAKMRLVELVLDIGVDDELVRQQKAQRPWGRPASSAAITDAAKQRIHDEILAGSTGRPQDAFGGAPEGGFFEHLHSMARADDPDARAAVKRNVARYTDAEVKAANAQRAAKKSSGGSVLRSVASAASQLVERRSRELADQRALRQRTDHADRVQRTDQAVSMLRRGLADLTPLLHVEPVEYKTDIGKREAAVHEMREAIARGVAEEERLLQERQVATNVVEATQRQLSAETDAACQQLVLLQRELESKESDLREMESAQAGGSGAWARSTLQLEQDLSAVFEEEFHLRREADDVRRTNDAAVTEKATLDHEIATGIEELADEQRRYQEVVGSTEGAVTTGKQALYKLREEERGMAKEINDLCHRLQHRAADVRRQTREHRSTINDIISRLSVEDRQQSALMARAQELKGLEERIAEQAQFNKESIEDAKRKVQGELEQKNFHITQAAERLACLYAGRRDQLGEVKMSALQLQAQIDQLAKEWMRVEWDAASTVAQTTSRLDRNSRESERILGQLAKYVVLQEDTAVEGVDIATTTTEQLADTREQLITDVTMRAYREAKYTQTIRLLRDRIERRARQGALVPLTRHRHVPSKERLAKRLARRKSRAAAESARSHVTSFREPAAHSTRVAAASTRLAVASTMLGASSSAVPGAAAGTRPVAGVGADRAAAEFPHFRRMVIDFVKKELQPLYDRSEVSRERFIDCVDRVSTWFLETHPPAAELVERDMDAIVRNIQAVLTWQDDERLRARSRT